MGKTPSYPVRIVHFNFKIECAPLRSKPCYFRLVVSENLVVFYARAHRMHTGRTANELCALRKRARRKKINILILIFCSPVGMKTKKNINVVYTRVVAHIGALNGKRTEGRGDLGANY